MVLNRSSYWFLSFLVALCAAAPPPSLEVSLRTGRFRGVATGTGTEKWLGIPFAQPPVGALRFKAPVAIREVSSAVKDASAFGHACPQPASNGLGATVAEDCLVLNVCISPTWPLGSCLPVAQVWRPQGLSSSARLPVLLWIHVRSPNHSSDPY